jgi:two-component sensor histidine kinase
LFEFTESFRPESYFDPAWMSSSYAVRQIGNRFRAINADDAHGGYFMKDAAINARSPENEADAVEVAFLKELQADPELVMRSYTRELDGKPYMQYLRRGEVLEDSCLRCHGDPALAPEGLVELYGPERSFYREAELGKVISVISIRIPLSASFANVERFSFHLSGLLLTLLACLFMAQYWVSKRLFYTPIAAIRDKALQISSDENRLGEQVPIPFGAEWRELASAFNAMSAKLRRERDSLEDRIQERTTALEAAKRSLEDDIEERVQIEKALKDALDENVNLLGELRHRAKNSFMMITGLVYLLADAGASEETRAVLEDLASRVQSVSELYSLLYSSGSTRTVRLDDYCSHVAGSLVALSENVSFKPGMASCSVPVRIAAPVGLIVTELVTNALKYAFPGARKGVVSLILEQTAGGLRLVVSDDGVGLDASRDPAGSTGTGLKLVHALVKQIDGHLSIRKGAIGTECVLEFPVG